MHQPRSVRIEPPSPPPTRTPGRRGRGGRERRGRCPEPSGADGLAVPTAPTPHPPARPLLLPLPPPPRQFWVQSSGSGGGGGGENASFPASATLPLCKRRASRWRRGAGCEDCAGSRGAGVDRRRPTGRWEACFRVAETERPTAAVTQSRRPSGALHGSWNPAKTLL